MGWFRKRERREAEELPVNTEFSVVSGNLVLASGETVAFTTVAPTVFNGLPFPGESVGAVPQREETAWLALQIAQDTQPGCQWQSEYEVDLRPATPDETAWALANGVNERFR